MGVAFKDLFLAKEISLDSLGNKIVILDAYNVLYQFLTTIRGRDGSLLTDSSGNVTSHLVGLFSRTTNLMQKNLKLAFVFDGKAPDLKMRTIEERKSTKMEAEKRFLEAKKKEDFEDMRKFAARTTRLTKDMVVEAKKLILNLGLPIVEAPSEGEAQAAYMVTKSDGFAVASQDFDSLVHGANRLVRNLSITGKRKKGKAMVQISPEIIELSENLNHLGIDQDQLTALAMIVGTDYNPGGIKGIGPKTALKLVKRYGNNFDSLYREVKWSDTFDFSWEEVYHLIKKIPTTDNYNLKWTDINQKGLMKMLVDEHNFSEERVGKSIGRLIMGTKEKQQKSLGDF